MTRMGLQRLEMEASCRENCGSCGADIEPSIVFVWHYDWEDCRALKQPVSVMELQRAARDRASAIRSARGTK